MKRREFITLLQADAAAGLAVMLVSNWPPSAAPTSGSRDIRAKNTDLAKPEQLSAQTLQEWRPHIQMPTSQSPMMALSIAATTALGPIPSNSHDWTELSDISRARMLATVQRIANG
jgi:hypothetical protein